MDTHSASLRRKPRADATAIAGSTRERLIIEGERLFAERGIDGVTMRMVCEAAEMKFAGSVQYYFGDAAGLLYAVFEYREEQLQPARQQLMDYGHHHQLLGDVRHLLRILYEPYFRMYAKNGNISFIKCHAAYQVTHRPRGVEHPVDRGSPATYVMRETMELLVQRLSAMDPVRSALRLESVGGMFLHGIIEYAANPERSGLTLQQFYDELIDMMVAAISVLPRPLV